jgi:hypothetical protein
MLRHLHEERDGSAFIRVFHFTERDTCCSLNPAANNNSGLMSSEHALAPCAEVMLPFNSTKRSATAYGCVSDLICSEWDWYEFSSR